MTSIRESAIWREYPRAVENLTLFEKYKQRMRKCFWAAIIWIVVVCIDAIYGYGYGVAAGIALLFVTGFVGNRVERKRDLYKKTVENADEAVRALNDTIGFVDTDLEIEDMTVSEIKAIGMKMLKQKIRTLEEHKIERQGNFWEALPERLARVLNDELDAQELEKRTVIEEHYELLVEFKLIQLDSLELVYGLVCREMADAAEGVV